ncbi:MAG TPA: glycosyltransferase family 39 protein [Thermoleophilaceae bacterium]
MSPRRLTRMQLALLALVAAGAAVRFSTLDVQSFWLDEGITVRLLRTDLLGMLGDVPRSEQAPPLYYVLAWLWTRPFGTGEVGVRSLSALLGTATVPIAFAAGRRLLSERAGVIAAALAAFSPLLVWYSQEARSYALLVPLAGLTIVLFLRALEPAPVAGAPAEGPRALWAWAAVAALALATHYFALFLVAPQALLLLMRAASRRAAARAVAAVAIVGAALLPLAIHQAGHGGAKFIGGTPLATRAVQIPKQFLVGYDSPAEVPITLVAALLAALALFLVVTRADAVERRRAGIVALLAAVAVGVPLLLSIVGIDYLVTRNVIGGWPPFALVLAAGFGARRAGLVGPMAAAALCALGLTAIVAVDVRPEFQRDDWRGAVEALGPPTATRAIVLSPVNGGAVMADYTRNLRRFPGHPTTVGEIDLLAVAHRRPGQTPRPARPAAPRVPGFRVVERRTATTFTLIRLRADRPLPFTADALDSLRLEPVVSETLIQSP